MNKIFALLLFLSLFLTSCSSVIGPVTKKKYYSKDDLGYLQEVIEDERGEYLKQHPKLGPQIKKAISEGKLLKGMAPNEVRASWGSPDIVYRTKTNNFVHEQWLYKNLDPKTYNRVNFFLTFKEGILASWQEQ